jgi:hypothetical protein
MIKLSSCCGAEMRGAVADMGICPDCKEHCGVEEEEMEDEEPEKLLTPEQAEEVLADIIDTVYLSMKEDFVNYEDKTHKLGFFKENVKLLYNQRMAIYKLTGKLNY